MHENVNKCLKSARTMNSITYGFLIKGVPRTRERKNRKTHIIYQENKSLLK